MKIKVALFVNGWNGENVDSFIEGFNSCFSNGEADLFVFTSYSKTGGSLGMNDAEDTIYSLPDFSFFDAVIIFGSGFKSEDIIDDIISRSKQAGVPVILQGVDSEEVTTVAVDCYVGMDNLCKHLIEVHDVKDVVYIAGTEDNADSAFRMEVLKKNLEAHGLSLESENIFYADWDPIKIDKYLDEQYGEGKAKLPDAFVCANDQMAIFAILFLEQMGYRTPDDIIVTGFDNLSEGKICYPSLATVNQGYHEQGNECARLVTELLGDKKLVKKCVIPCKAMPGESCGCMECNGETELRKKNGRVWWNERYISDNLKIREIEFDMCLTLNENYEDIHKSMDEDFLASVGEETEDFHVYINPQYRDLAYMDDGEGKTQEISFSPVMDVICARTAGVIYHENTFDVKKLFLGYDANAKGKTYILKPLVIESFVVGYMVMDYTSGAYARRKYFEFSSNVSNTLTKYQRIISDMIKSKKIQEQANEFLTQTVEALAAAVDAKDSYTNGHSNRVAKYSRMIAQESGMTEAECDEVYLAGLLHDVGKIGIDDRIINKNGKLTNEEFAVIKQHPALGGEILSKIMASPSLSVGARFHHERYDGRGYPEKYKADEIPRIARIIAVADSYDAMTSKRSYRNIIPKETVREELVKGTGTQFDPEYARIMIKFMDQDVDYTMRERHMEEVFGADLSYRFDDYKSKVSVGTRITECPVSIKIKYKPLKAGGQPTLLFYDSADEMYHLEDTVVSREMDFIDYVSVDMKGNFRTNYVRQTDHKVEGGEVVTKTNMAYEANLYMVKQEDHLLVKVTTDFRTDEFTFAMHDASRYIYLALTGEHCSLDILDVEVSPVPVEKDYIPRIVDKISYIDGPAGDIPNVQIDGWVTDHSEIIKVDKDISLTFHTMSLPSSRRIWHCPIAAMFTSDDGQINGATYRELLYSRFDGSAWGENGDIESDVLITESEDFDNWSTWKKQNKAGVDCKLKISRVGDVLEVQTYNAGLESKCLKKIPSGNSDIYLYLTGDQCALTDIRIDK